MNRELVPQSSALCRQTLAEFKKSQAKNTLQLTVCFHQLGRIRDLNLETRNHRASGLALDVVHRRDATIPDELWPIARRGVKSESFP
jgi:hypothetical protein